MITCGFGYGTITILYGKPIVFAEPLSKWVNKKINEVITCGIGFGGSIGFN